MGVGISTIISHHLLGARLTHTPLFLVTLLGCYELLFTDGEIRGSRRGKDLSQIIQRGIGQKVFHGSALSPAHSLARAVTR